MGLGGGVGPRPRSPGHSEGRSVVAGVGLWGGTAGGGGHSAPGREGRCGAAAAAGGISAVGGAVEAEEWDPKAGCRPAREGGGGSCRVPVPGSYLPAGTLWDGHGMLWGVPAAVG